MAWLRAHGPWVRGVTGTVSNLSVVLPWARPSTRCYHHCCVLLQMRKLRL